MGNDSNKINSRVYCILSSSIFCSAFQVKFVGWFILIVLVVCLFSNQMKKASKGGGMPRADPEILVSAANVRGRCFSEIKKLVGAHHSTPPENFPVRNTFDR